MKPAPLLSIVTITRQNRTGLAMTAKSLAAQVQTDFEWIVIDGASNDGTAELLGQAPRPPDIVLSQPDHGIYDAMNKGLSRANGEYTLFLNAGDSLPAADTLPLIYQELSRHRPDFLYGDALEQNLDGRQHYKSARTHKKSALGLFTHHQAMIYKTALLNNFRYNLDYKIAADYDLTLRFLKEAKHVRNLSAPLCIFTAGGLSQTAAHQGRAEQFTIRKRLKTANILQNILIYAAQYLNWYFRKLTPGAYWFLKRSA